MIRAIGRVPVERSTDYEQRRVLPDQGTHGPRLGPGADGTPLLGTGDGGAADAASADD
jgi:FO synthase subunit 2